MDGRGYGGHRRGGAESAALPKALKIIEEEAFFGDPKLEKAVLPEGLTEIHARAFAQSGLKEINLPSTLAYIAEDAFDGIAALSVSAPESGYAHDWAVAHGYLGKPLTARSLLCSLNGDAKPGDEIMWVARSEGGSGKVEYQFNVYHNDQLTASQAFSSRNFISVTLDALGSWRAEVVCRDEKGAQTAPVTHTVEALEPPVRIESIAGPQGVIVAGEQLAWTVTAADGTSPLSYAYELLFNGECFATQGYSSRNTYLCTAFDAGVYTLSVTCRDGAGRTAALISEEVTVYSEAEAIPDAPALVFAAGEVPFAATEASAPEYAPQSFQLRWQEAANASSYALKLEKKTGESWETVLTEEMITEEGHALDAALFRGLAGAALYRLSLTAHGLRAGEAAVYYFRVVPVIVDETITVNGQSSIIWQQSMRYASVRSFTVASELEWTVQDGGDEWVTCAVSGDTLTIRLSESEDEYSRDTAVVVGNGAQSVTISIEQGTGSMAPELVQPMAFSRKPESPTEYPAVPFTLRWINDSKRTRISVYDLTDGGKRLYRLTSSGTSVKLDESKVVFQSGRTYAIELAAIHSSSYATREVESDLLTNVYYVRMTEGGHWITVNGQQTAAFGGAFEQSEVYIEASGFFTASSDAEWLSTSKTLVEDNGGYVAMEAAINTTGTTRTGHVTFTCGAATAVVTVVQDDMTLKILYPDSVSQTESSPTTLYMDLNLLDTNYYYMPYQGEDLYMEVYRDGAYGSRIRVGNESTFGKHYAKISSEDVYSGNTRCRLTVEYGTASAVYYVRFYDDETRYESVIVEGDLYEQRKAPASGATLSIDIYAETGWKVTSDASWLVPSVKSGTKGSKTITATVQPNTTGAVRTGTLAFVSTVDESRAWYEVTQSAEEYVLLYYDNDDINGFELYDPARHCTEIFDGSGDETADFLAYAPDYCKITSNASWLDSSVSSPDPGEPFSLEMDANNTGAVRTGTVTVTYGSVSKTITVKQAPALGAISLTSPSLATSKTSPTVISYGDLTLKWPRIANAAQYTISTMYYDDGVIKLADTGASSYSCVIPKEWFDPYRTSYQCIYLYAKDAYGYEKSQTFYVKVAAGELVQLNGQTAPAWSNAPDVAVQETFAVEATGNWTASADQAWITLSAPSGASGDSLTVSLAENLSANARTGHVTVKSGSASAVLAISQCAYLAQEKPTLLSPLYSEDKGAPTAISPTDSLTFHWLYEPQTITCHLTLHRFKDENRTETLAESPRFNTAVDSYTFTGLQLQKGELYYVKLHRYTDRWNRTSRTFYFTLSDANAWVKLDDASAAEMETDGDGGSEVFDVTASGYWMARANDDWLMVHKASLDEEDLAEDEKTAADYALYGNVSGTALYVSALPNPGSAPRTGTVTVTCGSASAVITVTQYQNYTTAALTSHTLGGKPSASVDVPFGAMNLRWNKADGGTGRYEIILYESENRISYYKVLSSDGITAQSYSIPSGKFTEGMYYRLWLGTEVADDDYAGQNYYFRMQYRNQLTAAVSLSQSSATVGTHLGVSATASGGAGGYQYAFQLLDNGNVVQESTYGNRSTYSFAAPREGEYQVRVYVRDSAGNVASAVSGSFAAEKPADTLSLSRTYWAAEAAGGSVELLLEASSAWQAQPSAGWLTVSSTGESVRITAEANAESASREAGVSFTCGTASAILRVVQSGAPAQTDALALSRASWNLESPAASGLTVLVTASGAWSIQSKPDWITATISPTNGSAALYADVNEGTTRYGEVVFACGSVTRALAVSQPGSDVPAMVTSIAVSEENCQVGQPQIFTVQTSGADRVVLMVDGVYYPDDTAYVFNDTAILHRTFTAAGERRVQFVPWAGDRQGLASEVLVMNVGSQGQLAAPEIEEITGCYVNEACTIQWNDVPNATQYALYLKQNGSPVLPKITVKESQWELPEAILRSEGVYTLQVIATGEGWSQSENAVVFSVARRVKNFALLAPQQNNAFVCSDKTYTLKASNPDQSNLAFQVTYDGQTYYYPEEGTLNAAEIELTAPILGAGEYTVRAEAYADASRSGTPWDFTGTVGFTVNGPIKISASVGGRTYDKNLFSKDATFITVTTNNATHHIDVTLDGRPLFTLGEADRTVNGFQYTFRKSITPPETGYHVFGLHAEDGQGNAADWSLPYYVIQYQEPYVMYPNGAAGIVMTDYPVSSRAVVEQGLSPSEPMNVEGEYGDFLYGEYDGSYGYVNKDSLSPTRTGRWDGLSVSFVETNTGVPDIMEGDPNATIRLSWNCSVDLPEHAVFRLYLRDEMERKLTLIYEGWDTEYVHPTKDLPIYQHWAIVQVESLDGTIVYEAAQSGKAVCDVWSEEEYLKYVDKDFGTSFANMKLAANHLLFLHDTFDRGFYDENNQLVEGTPINPTELTSGKLFTIHALVVEGYGIEWWGSDATRAAYLAEQIALDMAPKESKTLTTTWSTIEFVLNMIDLPGDIIIPLTDLLKEFCDEKGKFSITQQKWKDTWEKNKVESNAKAIGILGELLFDMLQLYLQFSNIPDGKREELLVLIDEMIRSGDETLETAAEYLWLIYNRGFALFEFLVYAHAPSAVQDLLIYGLTKGAEKLINLLPSGSLVVAGLALGYNSGKWVNNMIGNLDDIQMSAFQWEWAVDSAKAYRTQFEKDYALFCQNPLEHFETFVESASMFALLVKKEFDAYDEFLKQLDKSAYSGITNFLMNRMDYEELSPWLKQRVTNAIEGVKFYVDSFNNYHVSRYGIKRAEWVGP